MSRPRLRRFLRVRLLLLFLLAYSGAQTAQADDLQPQLHYRPSEGWLGDAHPVFWGGQWHVYYLQIPQEPLRHDLDNLHSAEIVSTDLLHWSPQPITHTDSQRTWWAIANLRVGGILYSFYNGTAGFDLATSSDGKVWSPYRHNPVVPYPHTIPEIRDPVIFWEEATGQYWLVVAGKHRQGVASDRAGRYLKSTSTDLLHWSPLKSLYDPGNIGIPECPDLFKLGNLYYLLGSWGIDRVGQGRYRVADRLEGPWRTPVRNTLDGTELMAPNTGQAGKRRLFFGWIPTYKGKQDFAPYEWGGHLAFPRELYRDAGGDLYLRLPREFLTLRTGTFRPHPAECEIVRGDWKRRRAGLELAEGSASGEFWLPGTRDRYEVEATLLPSRKCVEVGLVFRTGTAGFGGYEVALDLRKQRLFLRRHGDPNRSLAETAIHVPLNTPLKLRVFVDGDIVEAFLADRFSLAGRAQVASGQNRTGFYVIGGRCAVNRPTIYRLQSGASFQCPQPLPNIERGAEARRHPSLRQQTSIPGISNRGAK